MVSWLVVGMLGGCGPTETGFDALTSLGIYSVSIDVVEEGCPMTAPALPTPPERVAIEAIRGSGYAELYVLDNPAAAGTSDGEGLTSSTGTGLGRLEEATFYARTEDGPTECGAAVVREYFAVVDGSIEITASTRWTGVAACDGIAVPDWQLPPSDCDTTEIYDLTLQDECEEPCSLAWSPRVIHGVRRGQPTCSCPETEADPDADSQTSAGG